jgi:rhodanese-related sulfurtransferase
MKNLIGILSLCICLMSCKAQTANVLDASAFEELTKKENIQLIDVRTKAEFDKAHLANALQINWNDANEFAKRSAALAKNKTICIYCLSGGRSAAAAKSLRDKGYTVIELKGGITNWKNSDKPTVSNNPSIAGMTKADFDLFISSHEKVLVDFGATWCPPCIKMNPIVDSFAAKTKIKVLKIDLDKDAQLCQTLGITDIPVFVGYENGQKLQTVLGVTNFEGLQNLFKK